MGWAKDGLAQLVGTVVGGVIALGATWLTNYGSANKDYAAERRAKLEVLVADVFQAHACTLKLETGATSSEGCDANIAETQSLAYAKLYFPDLYDAVSRFETSQFDARSVFLQCMLDSSGKSKTELDSHRVECMDRANANVGKEQHNLDSIVELAQHAESTMVPQPLSLSALTHVFSGGAAP